MTSYFEFDESVQIPYLNEMYLKLFGKSYTGVCVEVGAYDGITCSNVIGLIMQGWSALLIEPIPEYAQKILQRFCTLSNVRVLQTALGREPGVHPIHKAGALSSMNPELIREYHEISWAKDSLIDLQVLDVPVSTLDIELSKFLSNRELDVLSIDVEGFENQVFQGFTLEKFKPKLLIVELSDFHPHIKTSSKDSADLYLKIVQSGYLVIYKDAINTVFLRQDIWKSIFLT